MRKSISFCGLAVLLCAAGCATSGGLTRQDVFTQYVLINQLNTEITQAEGKEAAVLAPDGLEKAHLKLVAAIESAQDGEKDRANASAEKGIEIIENVRKHMQKSREVMQEVLDTRERAKREGAPGLYPERFTEADEQLRRATVLIEHDNMEKASELRPEILDLYSDLELKALKEGTAEAARAAVRQAEENEADDYAPKTFKAAEEEQKLITSVLEADRTQTDKARAHAERTIFLARRAEAITELAMLFEEKDFELEDIILWYQEQLEYINEPLVEDLPFDKPNQAVVQVLRENGENLLKVLADTRGMMEKKQQRIQNLEEELRKEKSEHRKKLSEQARKSAEALAAEKQAKQKFDEIDAMFSDEEAAVVQKQEGVLIQAHGFYFPPGGSEIISRNFALLNKIIAAINIFPDSKVIVSGHTDSRGNPRRNLRLSKRRASKVAQFFTKLGGLKADRITSEGYGEEKPVETNETKEGRARNRRIEILIVK